MIAAKTCGVSKHGNLTAAFELVTPQLAAQYLEKKAPNRNLTKSHCQNLTRVMDASLFQTTHQGIAFDEEDRLIDGQNRLTAIVKSGKAMTLLVTRGLPYEAIEVIDKHRVRTLAHLLQIQGGYPDSNRLVNVARRMILGPTPRHITPPDLFVKQFIDIHLAALTFAMDAAPRSQAPAQIAALLARAYYHVDHDRLRRFILALNDKIPTDQQLHGDQSARALEKVWSSIDNISTREKQTELYRKAQRALQAYMNRRDITFLRPVEEDLYPLPAK